MMISLLRQDMVPARAGIQILVNGEVWYQGWAARAGGLLKVTYSEETPLELRPGPAPGESDNFSQLDSHLLRFGVSLEEFKAWLELRAALHRVLRSR